MSAWDLVQQNVRHHQDGTHIKCAGTVQYAQTANTHVVNLQSDVTARLAMQELGLTGLGRAG